MKKALVLVPVLTSFLFSANSTFAAVSITGASGGSAISADNAANTGSPTWTTLGPITIAEPNFGQRGNYAAGSGVTLVLKAPAGFEFNTAVTPDISFTASKDITAASVAVTDSTTITVTLSVGGTSNQDSLQIGTTTGLQVRATSSSPLATGAHIYRPSTGGGNAVINGVTASADGTTGSNFGTLTEVGGAPTSMVIATQPSSTALSGIAFAQQPVIQLKDQFGNISTGDNTTVVNATRNAGTGTLLGATSLNAVNGVVTYTNLAASEASTITIDFSSSSLPTVTSDSIVVDPGPPAATALVIQQQPSATATAGVQFGEQPVIAIFDQYGAPFTNDNTTVVTAARFDGAGTLQGTLTATAVNGVATFTDLSHTVATNITIQFTATNLTSAVSATVAVSPAAADRLAFAVQPGAALVGLPFGTQPVVKTTDQFGNDSTVGLAANLDLTLTLSLGAGPLSGTVTSDIGTAAGNGVATFSDLSIGTVDANNQLTASATNLLSATSDIFAVSPIVPARLTISIEPSTNAVAGQAFATQPVVRVEDANGNLVASDNSTTVTATRLSGTGALQGTTSVVVSGGIATFTDLSHNVAGTINIQFTSSGLSNAVSGNIEVSPATATTLAFSVQPAGAYAGAAFTTQPVLQARDAFGNISNVGLETNQTVTLTLTSGTGALIGTTTADISTGVANFSDVGVDVAGLAKQITATSSNLTDAVSAAFNVGGVAPATVLVSADTSVSGYTTMTGPTYYEGKSGDVGVGTIVLVAPAGYEFDTGGSAPTVRIQKISGPGNTGNIVGSGSVISGGANNAVWPITSRTTTEITFTVVSNTVGVADSLTWQNVRIRATSGSANSGVIVKTGTSAMAAVVDGVTPFATLTTVGGAAAHMVIETQPASSAVAGVAFAPQPVIRLEDQFNNLATNDSSTVVTAVINQGSASLQGTTPATAVNGYVTFTDLAYNVAEAITINFTNATLGVVTSDTVTVTPAAADHLEFTTQPAGAVVGYPFAIQPVVKTKDQFGNLSSVGLSNSVIVTISLSSGSGSLTGNATSDIGTAAGNGVATFADLGADTAGTGKQLTADAAGLTSAISDTFTVTTADHLVYVQGDNQSGFAGTPLALDPTVQVVDTNGAPVEGVAVNFAVQSGGGSVGSAVVLSDSNGLASTTFTLGPTAGISNNVLLASALIPGNPNAITFYASATNSVGTKLAIAVQPSSTAVAGEVFAQQPQIQITDDFGNFVADDNTTVVSVARGTGTGALNGTLTATAVNGVATFTDLSYNVAETIDLVFTATQFTGTTSAPVVITPAAISKVAFTTQPGNGYANADLLTQPVVQTQDQFSNNSTNGLPDSLIVSVALTTGSGQLLGTTSLDLGFNAGTGVATFTNLQVTTGGIDKQLTASATNLTSGTSATFWIGGVDPATSPIVPGDGSYVALTGPTYYEIASGDVGVGTIVLNAPAGFEFDTNGPTPTVLIQRTSGTGNPDKNINQASNSGKTEGASSVTPTQITFTVTSSSTNGVLNSLTWQNVRVRSFGIPSGLSNITKTGTSTLAAVTSETNWGTLIGAPRAAKLVITTQPSATATAGAAFAQQPVIRVEDQFGNLWTSNSVNVTAGIASGTGSLQGTVTVASVDGFATFTGLSYNVAETISLSFSGSLLLGATSDNIVVSPAAADHLVFATEPGGAVFGSALNPQPVVKTKDQFGNDSTVGLATNATVSLSVVSGTGSLVGTATLDISSGTATFSGLKVDAAGVKQLGASSAGLTSATSASFTIDKADQTITFAPIPNKTIGDAPFAVNASSDSGLPVTFTIDSGNATVSGNTITITGTGPVTVNAMQGGDSNYNAAPTVQQSFTVAAIAAPQIVTQSTSVVTNQGANVSFTIVASGGSLSYQWRHNGADIESGTGSTLTLNDVRLSDAGFYDVVITNTAGTVVSSGANLTVLYIPNDIDLNGQSDILFQNTSGVLAAWLMDGTNFLSSQLLRGGVPAAAGWKVVGQGDFNDDGESDLLFQGSTGKLAVWFMSGTNILGSTVLRNGQAAATGWLAVGTGDINDDGKTDIIFQHTDGRTAVWYMNNSTFVSSALLRGGTKAGAGWKVVGVSDMNGDTKPDLFFQHTGGRLAVWTMDGTSLLGTAVLTTGPSVESGWKVVGLADFNKDGKTDVVWQNAAGSVAVWHLDGTTYLSSSSIRNGEAAGAGWFVVGPK